MRVLPRDQVEVPVKVEIAVSPSCEMLLGLSVFNSGPDERGIYDVGPSWFAAVEQSASRQLLNAIEQIALPHVHTWTSLLGLAWTTPAPGDVPTFLAHLEGTDALDLRVQTLETSCEAATHGEITAGVVGAATRGDSEARKQLLESWSPSDPKGRAALNRLLSSDPEADKRRIIEVLGRWYEEVFQADEQRVIPILQRDAEARRHQARTLSSERLIELATNGVRYAPTPGLRRVVLIPSVVFRPWVMITQHLDARIYCHPVADETLTANQDVPPLHLLRLYEALADERRLRIVRRLTQGTMTLQEMAEFLGIAKSTMHHHLAILRGAGLLQTESGSKRYGLREDALSDLSNLLHAYLDTPTP